MDIVTMNTKFNEDVKEFEKDLKAFLKKRKIAKYTVTLHPFYFC